MKGFEHMTESEALRLLGRKTLEKAPTMPIAGPTEPKAPRSKYGATKTTVDGITFDSAKEAARYGELKLLEKAGELSELETQPRFSLNVRAWDAPVSLIIGEYRGDFRYRTSHGATVVEDVKGLKTALYRWKKKHVEAQYGIKILET